MRKERKIYERRRTALSRCDYCGGLHLTVEVDDRSAFVAVLDAAEWADLFMADGEFAKAVAARLGRH